MKLQKLPSDLSVEELLKALQDNIPDSPKEEVNSSIIQTQEYTGQYLSSYPVLSFIDAFKIRRGNHLVSDHILYNLFKVWDKITKLTKRDFNTELARYIEVQRSSVTKIDIKYFKVNAKAAKLAHLVEEYKKTNKRKYLNNKNYRIHYEKFFNDLDITPGSLYIEADVFYHVYDTYMYKRNRKSHPYLRFELICGLFFEQKYFDGTNTPWFGVSENIKQHISIDAVSNWRKGRMQFNENKNRKPIKEEDKVQILYPETTENKKIIE